VDGIDPDYVEENGYSKFRHNLKLNIPDSCYIQTDHGREPHTTRVWPTIFSGNVINYGLKRRGKTRQVIHDFLVKNKLTWAGSKGYDIAPVNINLDTVFDHYHSFKWNIPTICPEWISSYPDIEAWRKYMVREYQMWIMMSLGCIYSSYDLIGLYTRRLDYVGHQEPKKMKDLYLDIFEHAHMLNKKGKVILLSDHGCIDKYHTDHAYMGSDLPISAESVNEVRTDIENLMKM
jgi:hypothetical protein